MKTDQVSMMVMSSVNKSNPAPGRPVRDPVMESVSIALNAAFDNGGSVTLSALDKDGYYLRDLSMVSLVGRFRMTVLTYGDDSKTRLMEWWEPVHQPFRGTERFGDDDWDARTVCKDLDVAIAVFEEFLDSKRLIESITQFRSSWDPKD